MSTQCSEEQFLFEAFAGRKVVGAFDGGAVTSIGGALLLREADRAIGLTTLVANCFADRRLQEAVIHTKQTLLAQRVHGIALGYEDISDHDDLRHDPVLALLSDTDTPKRKDVATLAGKSTLQRLETAPATGKSRYHKFKVDEDALADVFPKLYIGAHKRPPKRIILDLDATDDPLHGHQEGRFFHGYYRCYCYLPLYIFAGRHLLVAKLRRADQDAAAGTCEEVQRIVTLIRAAWPDVEIWLRADSGFARDDLMTWCEENRVAYIFGLAKNTRLVAMIKNELANAEAGFLYTRQATRVFKDLRYRTRKSWSCERRVVAKAEHLAKGANPRFIVTSLTVEDFERQELYEKHYCQRGEMENRIKECQLDMFADRTSAATMRANQLRLWFASLAYVLVDAVRRLALQGSDLARATCGTIRLKLLRIAAVVTTSVRRIKVAFATACPQRHVFAMAHQRLTTAAA